MNLPHDLSLAVIIPTYNRVAELRRCLQSINLQSLPRDKWEVIAVNDGGVDVTEIVQSFGNNFRAFYQLNQGPGAARNFGATLTTASVLLFIDDDCTADPNWLKEVYENIRPGFILGGKVINKVKESMFSESSQVLIDFLIEYNEGSDLQFFTTNNLAICRVDFLQIGGFSPDFYTSAGEDREFCVRAKRFGTRLVFHRPMLVFHFHHLDLFRFIALHVKYGRAAWTFHQIINRGNWGIKSYPQWKFYKRLLTFPFSLNEYTPKKKLLLSVCLFLSQGSVGLGYLYERIRFKKTGPYTPPVKDPFPG